MFGWTKKIDRTPLREHSLKLALSELRSGRFAFPVDDTPILLAHLLERIEALENERINKKASRG